VTDKNYSFLNVQQTKYITRTEEKVFHNRLMVKIITEKSPTNPLKLLTSLRVYCIE